MRGARDAALAVTPPSVGELFVVARCSEHALVIRAPRGPRGGLPARRPCPACERAAAGSRALVRRREDRKPRVKRPRGTDEKFLEALREEERARWSE